MTDTMTFGAAAAKDRLDIAVRDFIKSGGIVGPRSLANCRGQSCRAIGRFHADLSLIRDGAK